MYWTAHTASFFTETFFCTRNVLAPGFNNLFSLSLVYLLLKNWEIFVISFDLTGIYMGIYFCRNIKSTQLVLCYVCIWVLLVFGSFAHLHYRHNMRQPATMGWNLGNSACNMRSWHFLLQRLKSTVLPSLILWNWGRQKNWPHILKALDMGILKMTSELVQQVMPIFQKFQ